jgi:hypothetical protein
VEVEEEGVGKKFKIKNQKLKIKKNILSKKGLSLSGINPY